MSLALVLGWATTGLATPPLNSYTGTVGAASQSFYRLKLQ